MNVVRTCLLIENVALEFRLLSKLCPGLGIELGRP